MTVDRCLSSDLDEVIESSRASDPDLRNDHATPADLHIMTDLDEVIEARACTNDGVPR
jgi:hypothetical protein